MRAMGRSLGVLLALTMSGMLVSACAGAGPGDNVSAGEESLGSSGCVPMQANADNDDSANIAKYDNYMTRFLSKFIVVSAGNERGTNIPFDRQYWSSPEDYGNLVQGENSHAPMGQWVGVLATEYALKNGRSGQDLTPILQKLRYALQAFDRLDDQAEAYYRIENTWSDCTDYNVSSGDVDANTYPGDRNGYVLRNDMPCDFSATWFDGTHPPHASEPHLWGHDEGHGIVYVKNDWSDPTHKKYAADQSPEEIWGSLPGLALVSRLVTTPAWVDGQYIDFSQWAKDLVDRMITYAIEHDRWWLENPKGHHFATDWLRVRNELSVGLAGAGAWITGNLGYEAYVPSTAYGIWLGAGLTNADGSMYQARSMSAVGNIKYKENGHSTIWNLEHQTVSLLVNKNEHLPLIWKVLHEGAGTGDRINPQWYGAMLNSAPSDGPHWYGPNTGSSCVWNSGDRLTDPGDPRTQTYTGEFTGLDYMLLHNLYHLVYSAESTKASLYGSL